MFDETFFMVRHKGQFLPGPLNDGDKIAIISTSDTKEEDVMGVAFSIVEHGFSPVVMTGLLNPEDEGRMVERSTRILQMIEAVEDTGIRAIFCVGNAHGAFEVLPNFSYGIIARNPKWIVAWGDATALLAMWQTSDIASVHGPMGAEILSNTVGTEHLFNLLRNNGKFNYKTAATAGNVEGKAHGKLIGGNLSVLTRLASTCYDILTPHSKEELILFLEDHEVSLWEVRDMLLRICLTGLTFRIKGVVFGSFDTCRPYAHYNDIMDIVKELTCRTLLPFDVPIAFNFPIGKHTQNFPLVEGIDAELEVTDIFVSLKSRHPSAL